MNSDQRFLLIFLFISFFIVSSFNLNAQELSLSGYIRDALVHQPVSHARLELLETGRVTSTNDSGFFSFGQLAAGQYTLSVHHIAYATLERRILLHTHDNSLLLEMQTILFPAGEVIVQSTRTLSTIRNTPYPSIVKTEEQLTKIPETTISNILSRDPGVSLVQDGIWETAVSIRGMSRSNIISLIDNTRIETANDIAGALSLISIEDLERVETLKTPGSVLYGTGAFGGVVHFVTKRPQFSEQNEMHSEYSASMSGVNNGVSQHLAVEGSSKSYALRLSGSYRKAGNTITPHGELPNSRFNDFHVLGSIGIKTTGQQSLFISYQRSQADDTGIPGSSSFGTTASVRYALARRELFRLEYSLPNLTASLPGLLVRLSRQEITRNVEVLQGDTLRITPHAVHTTNALQIESRIVPLSNHFLVVGAEVWQRELDSRREKVLPKVNRLIGERPIPHSTYISGGIYMQDEWVVLPETWNMTFGVRYDAIAIHNDQVYNPEYTMAAGITRTNTADSTLQWQSNSARNKSWSASLGGLVSLHQSLDITFLAATAFRSPSLEERYQYLDLGKGKIQVGNPFLQPERSVSINTGLRFHTQEFSFQTDIFLNTLQDLIKPAAGTYNGKPALVNTNISQARIYGFEFSVEKTLTSWSIARGSLAYCRGEDIQLHSNLSQIAPLTARGELVGYFQRVGTLSISCSGMAAQNNFAAGESRTAGWISMDAGYVSSPLKAGRWIIILRTGIQNIFDAAYRNHLSSLRGLIKEEPGRNYYLSAYVAI